MYNYAQPICVSLTFTYFCSILCNKQIDVSLEVNAVFKDENRKKSIWYIEQIAERGGEYWERSVNGL